jgi:hypothetical protein
MTLATKNGSLIVKDGKIAENCGCCGDWFCYSPPIYCNAFRCVLPNTLSLSLSASHSGVFFQTFSVNTTFGTTYRNVKFSSPSFSASVTLTKESVSSPCNYIYNQGGGLLPVDASKPMFRVSLGGPWFWLSSSACASGFRYMVRMMEIAVVATGAQLSPLNQNVPPGHALFVAPENDSYGSPSLQPFNPQVVTLPAASINNAYIDASSISTNQACAESFDNPIQAEFSFTLAMGSSPSGQLVAIPATISVTS